MTHYCFNYFTYLLQNLRSFNSPKRLLNYYITDHSWIDKICNEIFLPKVGKINVICHILNPGTNSIIEKLLNNTVSRLVIHENSRKHYLQFKEKYEVDYKERFQCYPTFSMPSKVEENDHLLIYGCPHDMAYFVMHILNSFFKSPNLWRQDRLNIYALVDDAEYQMTQDPQKFWIRKKLLRPFLYKTFFSVQQIFKIPSSASNNAIIKNRSKLEYDETLLHVIKFDISKSLAQQLSSCDESEFLIYFDFKNFVKKLNFYRAHRLIPIIEKYCPNVGELLLDDGVGMFDQVRDVPLSDWFKIFKIIVDSAYYANSPLEHILDKSRITIKDEIKKDKRGRWIQ